LRRHGAATAGVIAGRSTAYGRLVGGAGIMAVMSGANATGVLRWGCDSQGHRDEYPYDRKQQQKLGCAALHDFPW